MAKRYSLVFKSPEVECSVQADTLSGLESAVSGRMNKLIPTSRNFSGMSLDEASAKALEIFREYQGMHGRRHRTRIEKTGVERGWRYSRFLTATGL